MVSGNVTWEVAKVTAIDKDCAATKTMTGQWLVCVVVEPSVGSVSGKDIGTFLVFAGDQLSST